MLLPKNRGIRKPFTKLVNVVGQCGSMSFCACFYTLIPTYKIIMQLKINEREG